MSKIVVYIVVEYWDETNGVSIKGVFTDPGLASKCMNKDGENRWIQNWIIEYGEGKEVE